MNEKPTVFEFEPGLKPPDLELHALRCMVAAMNGLNDDAQHRVISYLLSRYIPTLINGVDTR